jgi:hypothetical protein
MQASFSSDITETPTIGVLTTSDYIPSASDLYYVKDGSLQQRPTQSTNLSGLILSGLPIPCTINIQGTNYNCLSSTCTLDFAYPSNYRVSVSSWPFLDKEFEVITQ